MTTLPPSSLRQPHAGLTLCLGLALLGHVAIVGLMAAWMALAPNLRPPAQRAIMTKLVRLGTPRPKELLPRLPEPATAPTPAAVAPPVSAPPPPLPTHKPVALPTAPKPPKAAPVPSAKERIRALSRVNQALDRLKQAVDGQHDGSTQGDADAAVAGEAYIRQIDACLHAHYVIEGYAAERVAGRQAQVLLFINAAGRIIKFHLEQTSGLAAFDQAIGRAIRGCGKVDPPPPHLKEQVRRDGIEIVFKP